MKNEVKMERLLLLSVSITSVIFLNSISTIKAENSIEDINFDFPLNNTFNLGTPFLVDFSTTTGLKPIGIRTPDIATEDFNVTFSGSGIINYANKSVEHISNSSGIYITNPDGTVYQNRFYRIPSEFMVKNWYNRTPENFRFTVKFPKVITHNKRLSDFDEDQLNYFFDSISELKEKLLALLIQLPPRIQIVEGLDALRKIIPYLDKRFRYAVEVRHRSWFQDLAYNFFANNNMCLVWSKLAMPSSLVTVIKRSESLSNNKNKQSIQKFVDFMKSTHISQTSE